MVVMGVSGTGKSVVGRLLADRLLVEHLEGDDLHPATNIAAMRTGRPLTEEQRRPWLVAIAGWLGAHGQHGGVVSCSALRRDHRDLLRAGAPGVRFLHLTGDPELIGRRMAARRGHFMPAELLESQLATLEPPDDDEEHVTVDVALAPQQIVEVFLRQE